MWPLPEAGPDLGGSCSLNARRWRCRHCKDGNGSNPCPPSFVVWYDHAFIRPYTHPLTLLVLSGWHCKRYPYRLWCRGVPHDLLLLDHGGPLLIQRREDGGGHHQFHQEAQGAKSWCSGGSDTDGCRRCRRRHHTFTAVWTSERRAVTKTPYLSFCRSVAPRSVLRLLLRGISDAINPKVLCRPQITRSRCSRQLFGSVCVIVEWNSYEVQRRVSVVSWHKLFRKLFVTDCHR